MIGEILYSFASPKAIGAMVFSLWLAWSEQWFSMGSFPNYGAVAIELDALLGIL